MNRTILTRRDIQKKEEAVQPRVAPRIGSAKTRDEHQKVVEVPITAPSPPKPLPEELTPDGYTARLLKFIPGEVIALYLTLDAIIRSSDTLAPFVHWAAFGFGLLATFLYLWRVGGVTKGLQLTLSVGAFFVWVFAMGGPFVQVDWYAPIYGGLLLPVYTFLIPIIDLD